MANAEKQTETKVIVTGVNLSLSIREAMVLASVLSRVSGEPYGNSYRVNTDAIHDAIIDTGIRTLSPLAFSGSLVANTPTDDDLKQISIASNGLSLEDIHDATIDINVRVGNRIAAIKRLRELAPGTGLKEAKDEIDRRTAEYKRASW